MNTYFSADWHLDHANILKYDKRPFKDVDEMNKAILSNAIFTLQKGDMFYYLGDFAFSRTSGSTEGFLQAVSGTGAQLFFIKGNHDKRDTIKLYEKYGTYLGEQKRIKVPDEDVSDGYQEIILNHYAMRVWDKSHHGVWQLYGHSHDGLEKEPWGKSMDVGVPSAYRIKGSYIPFSYEDVKDILKKRPMKIIDHHGNTR